MANTSNQVREFQRKLYLRSKQEPDKAFYSLYDKICRFDILWDAFYLCKANKRYYDPEVKYFQLPKDSDSGSFVTEKYLNELRSVQSNTVVEMMPPEYDGLGHAVICDKCGLNYVPNLAEDRVLHHQFCTQFSSASEYFGRPLFTYEMFEKAKSVQLNDPNPTIADQAALYKNKLWGYFSRSVQAWMRQRDFKEHPPFFVYSQAMIASDLDDGHVSHDVAQYVAKDMGIEHLEQSPAMPSGSSYWAIDDNI